MNVPLVSWNWKISLLTIFVIILVALYSLIKPWPTFTNGLINFSNGFTNLVTKLKMFYKLDVKLWLWTKSNLLISKWTEQVDKQVSKTWSEEVLRVLSWHISVLLYCLPWTTSMSSLRFIQDDFSEKFLTHSFGYNQLDQLTCAICGTVIKNEIIWNAHLQSKKHKEVLIFPLHFWSVCFIYKWLTR